MNKYQARCKLIAGDKITHAHFLPGQYIHVVKGKTVTEEGHDMENATYNPFGYGCPVEGWGIYDPLNDEE